MVVVTSENETAPAGSSAPPKRAAPWEFARQVVGELRSSRWPSAAVAARSTAVVLSGLAGLAAFVWVLDLVFVGAVSRLFAVVGEVAVPFLGPTLVAVHVASLAVAAYLLLSNPAPSGGANLFGAAASETSGGATPSERRLDRRTAVAVAVYALSALALGLVL